MNQQSAVGESPLELILIRTLEKLKERGVMDEPTFLRLQDVIQEGKLGNRDAVISALTLPEENGE